MSYKRTVHTTYLVHWPDTNILKVGYSQCQRWRPFVLRGAVIVDLIEFPDSTGAFEMETVIQEALDRVIPRAYTSAEQAVDALGGRGGGWKECYRLPAGQTPLEVLSTLDWIAPNAA